MGGVGLCVWEGEKNDCTHLEGGIVQYSINPYKINVCFVFIYCVILKTINNSIFFNIMLNTSYIYAYNLFILLYTIYCCRS